MNVNNQEYPRLWIERRLKILRIDSCTAIDRGLPTHYTKDHLVTFKREIEKQNDPAVPRPTANGVLHPKADNLANLLEQVISATGSEHKASAEDIELRGKLNAVAARFPKQELSLDPVLVALVSAVTQDFRQLSAERVSAMNQSVAKTLFDDTKSRARLERLWHSLRGSVE